MAAVATAKTAADPVDALCAAIVSIKNAKEARNFLLDLCTPGELRALSERWHVAQLLNEGELSYREISDLTGVSTATIVRVARFLRDEQYGGYRTVLAGMRKKKS